VLRADWASPADVKREIGTASILKDGRAVLQERLTPNTTSVGKTLQRVGVGDKRRIVTARGRFNLISLCRGGCCRDQHNDEWRREYDKPAPQAHSCTFNGE
jgi:hypothetical protein